MLWAPKAVIHKGERRQQTDKYKTECNYVRIFTHTHTLLIIKKTSYTLCFSKNVT